MKRFFLVVIGIVILLVGFAAGAAGGAAVIVVGSDGRYDTAVGSASGQGYALLFNQFEVTGSGQESIRALAQVTVGARSMSGEELFIGMADSTQVAEYLAGVPHEVVTDVASGGSVSIPGSAAPKPPMDQHFWRVHAIGLDPVVDLAADPKKTTLVIMNANATPGVDAEVRIGIFSGSIFATGIGLIAFGAMLIILAVWLFVRAAKVRRNPPLPPSGGPPPASIGTGYLPPAVYPGQQQVPPPPQ